MDESWRGAQFGKMFESFANAAMKQILPRIPLFAAFGLPGSLAPG